MDPSRLWQGCRNPAPLSLLTFYLLQPTRRRRRRAQAGGDVMVAYLPRRDEDERDDQQPRNAGSRNDQRPRTRSALSNDLFHGLTPEEFDREAKALAAAEAM